MVSLIENRQARFEFELLDNFVAGLVLQGGEAKMLRGRHGSLAGSHVRIIQGKPMLLNAQIPPYPYARNENYEPKRSRELLLRKSEILKLQQAQETKGLTLIPVSIGKEGKYLKLRVAIARGKKLHDRREGLKRRDLDRQTAADLKRRR
jgi:SsrA-binding protein